MEQNKNDINSSQNDNNKSRDEETKEEIKKALENNGNITKISPEIIAQINYFIQHNEPFTKGTEGMIYKIPLLIKNTEKIFLVAKKRFDEEAYSEYQKHRNIQKIMKQKKEDNPMGETDTKVTIPKLHGYRTSPEDEDELEYIIMDYIDGKTLFTLATEKLLGENYSNDTESLNAIKKYIYGEENSNTGQDSEAYVYILEKIKNGKIKLFNEFKGKEQKQAIRNFIEYIHKNGFYHRDLGDNLRNIMIGKDDKIYIIDFGKSKIINADTKNDNQIDDIYTEHSITANKKNSYPKDEQILSLIDKLTKKKPKRNPRELNY